MSEFIIRKATTDDAKNILEYLNLVGGESDNLLFGENAFSGMSVEKEAELIEAINNSDRSVMLIGLLEGEIMSIGSLQGFSRKRIAHRGAIAITVRKQYWHQGFGTKMMKELISFGKNTVGMTVIHLEVKADNENAIKLYEKFGFRKIGLYEKFFKIEDTYYDANLMNLYLEEERN